MIKALLKAFVATASLASTSLVFDSKGRADDWGCEVILCLSNPGGATQYAECRPPVEKLWRELAKGHSFPSCSGVGFQASRPRYEPYYCDAGYRLTTRYGDRGQEASCVSTTPQTVASSECYSHGGNAGFSSSWHWNGGGRQCQRYVTIRPHVRSQPHYIDVTIDGVGRQRVWY
ncbi:hypothetical protein [Rhizobium herbae]|uniref:hypothetical protein n=1 Tax=Rhizobium herbae TaxID=508661 RepID=UPI001CB77150|nr:hypothetical protein [Rhizobium herbae]